MDAQTIRIPTKQEPKNDSPRKIATARVFERTCTMYNIGLYAPPNLVSLSLTHTTASIAPWKKKRKEIQAAFQPRSRSQAISTGPEYVGIPTRGGGIGTSANVVGF